MTIKLSLHSLSLSQASFLSLYEKHSHRVLVHVFIISVSTMRSLLRPTAVIRTPLGPGSQPGFATTQSMFNTSHYTGNKRSKIVNQPNVHVRIAHTVSSRMNDLFALFAKLQLLNSSPVREFCQAHPRIAACLKLVALVQLRPLSLLQAPLLKSLRPLHWLLAPFSTMALPVALTIINNCVKNLGRTVLPNVFQRFRRSHQRTLTPQFSQQVAPVRAPLESVSERTSPNNVIEINAVIVLQTPYEQTATNSPSSLQVNAASALLPCHALAETLRRPSVSSVFGNNCIEEITSDVGDTSNREDAYCRETSKDSTKETNSLVIPDTVTYRGIDRSIDYSGNNDSHSGASSIPPSTEVDRDGQTDPLMEGNTIQVLDCTVLTGNPHWFAEGIRRATGRFRSQGLAVTIEADTQPGISRRIK